MFNSYQYDQKVKFNKEIDKIKKDYVKERIKRKDLNQRLAQNYKKRVENFVISMLENPIVCNDYKSPEDYQFRDEDTSKNMGDPQIYVKGFKHEKDRIQEAQEKNNSLDFLPNLIVGKYCFRDRDPSKDMKRDVFRYRDKTALARIQQYLKDHTQSQVENMKIDEKKFTSLENFSEGMSHQERKAYLSKLIAKNLLPSLHNKTHFEAAKTMQNDLPLSLMEHSRSQPQVRSQEDSRRKPPNSQEKQKTNVQEDKFDDGVPQAKQGKEVETFNPVETSKQILKKCKVISERNSKVPVIHSGQGHLISTLDKSISEIYKELYQMNIGGRHSINK